MIWALGLIAPFLAFVALINFRVNAKRRALPPVQIESTLRDHTPPVATPEIPEDAPETSPNVDVSNAAVEKLRGTMEDGDENIFVVLQVALDEVVRAGHSLEVCTLGLT